MIPLPLIARAVVGGGVLALLIYELSKQGAAIVKAAKADAKTTEGASVPIQGEVTSEDALETKAAEMPANATTNESNKDFLKSFGAEAAKRTIKTHTTKTINKLLAGKAGTYAVVTIANTELMISLLEDYSKKYQAEVESGKLQLHIHSENEEHFLNAVIS